MILVFFFNDTATTEIYTLSLHDALPISRRPFDSVRSTGVGMATRGAAPTAGGEGRGAGAAGAASATFVAADRKSTRLNSSHANISYAVFCLKKKKKIIS